MRFIYRDAVLARTPSPRDFRRSLQPVGFDWITALLSSLPPNIQAQRRNVVISHITGLTPTHTNEPGTIDLAYVAACGRARLLTSWPGPDVDLS